MSLYEMVSLLLIAAVLVVVVVAWLRPAGGSGLAPEIQKLANDTRAEFTAQRSELRDMSAESAQLTEQRWATLTSEQEALRTAMDRQLETLRRDTEDRLDAMARRIQLMADANTEKHAELQKVLRTEIDTMRRGNEEKLDRMREVVDEKLQGTLEKRLGESFRLVSERLELVQKGLGEMQTLASDVGGLKRVLTNVKSRGTWGEVQLARQLEDVLTADQYASNVKVNPDSDEMVEFAIVLPGAQEDRAVYLPIDSKFPQEDYERLLDAQDLGEKDQIDQATKNLERAVAAQAKLISEKYIHPPHTTDFAILYLPTEGLFAEVIRIPGLLSQLQSQQRVIVTGPTLFATLLNSLQLGFRTLAIEKRSSEVWQVLSAAKAEFVKYGAVWEKLGKQLQTAQNTVAEAGRRTRAVERRLRNVESLTDIDSVAADGSFGEVEFFEEEIFGELLPPEAGE